jgi:hypothetical protein
MSTVIIPPHACKTLHDTVPNKKPFPAKGCWGHGLDGCTHTARSSWLLPSGTCADGDKVLAGKRFFRVRALDLTLAHTQLALHDCCRQVHVLMVISMVQVTTTWTS